MFKKVIGFIGGVVEKVKDVVTSKAALVVGGLGAATAMSARADDTLFTSLQGSATTAVTAALGVIGVVLLAGIAKPVAIKAYGIVKQVINKF